MRVLIFTQHYPPDVGAQSFRMESIVKAFLSKNHSVTIITSEPHRYSLLDNINKSKENEKGLNIEIYRVQVGKRNDIFWRRPLNYLAFMVKSLVYSLKITRSGEKFDFVLSASPPITSAMTACIYSLIKRKIFIFEVQDLWPEVLVELRIFRNIFIINFLKFIEQVLYQKASLIILVSEAFKLKIADKGINEKKIHNFPIGLDRQFIIKDISVSEKYKLRKKYNLPKNTIIISYTGNIGISQHLETLIEVVKKIKNNNILFLIVGEGLEKKKLLEISKKLKFDNKITFLNWLTKDSVKEIYKLSDILFLQLKDLDIFKVTIPSKIFEYLGSGKPIIYGLEGIAADILKKSGNGIKIRPENSDDLITAINKIINNYEYYLEKAREGRKFVIRNYLREKIMEKYVETLEEHIKQLNQS